MFILLYDLYSLVLYTSKEHKCVRPVQCMTMCSLYHVPESWNVTRSFTSFGWSPGKEVGLSNWVFLGVRTQPRGLQQMSWGAPFPWKYSRLSLCPGNVPEEPKKETAAAHWDQEKPETTSKNLQQQRFGLPHNSPSEWHLLGYDTPHFPLCKVRDTTFLLQRYYDDKFINVWDTLRWPC